jgi:hypothetical protein
MGDRNLKSNVENVKSFRNPRSSSSAHQHRSLHTKGNPLKSLAVCTVRLSVRSDVVAGSGFEPLTFGL